MATTKTPTIRDYYNELLSLEAVSARADLVEFIEGRIAQLDKKTNGEHKETANQKANTALRGQILEVMNDNQLYTITELIKLIPTYDGNEMTASKMNALIRPMLTVTANGTANKDGVINRVTEKGKTYFVKV